MNHNYPTSTSSLETVNDEREKEYRKELSESIIAESIGTVGIYTSLDLDDSDKVYLKQVIAERNPEGSGNEIRVGGGWGEWGESVLDDTSNPLLRAETYFSYGTEVEEVRFIATSDDFTELRYIFHSQAYKDGTGRPGNTLNVGFKLSRDKAAELHEALQADPTFMSEVIKEQVLAIGLSEKLWDERLKPRIKDGVMSNTLASKKDHVLDIMTASKEGEIHKEKAAYADKKAMLPAYEQPAATEELQSSPENSVDLNAAWEESYEETRRIMDMSISHSLEQGKTDSAIRAELAELLAIAEREMYEAEANEQNDPEDAARSRAMYIAYSVVADEFNNRQADVVHQAELTQDQLGQIGDAQAEVESALAEVSRTFNPGDIVTIGGKTKTVVDGYTMQNGAPMVVVQDSYGSQQHVKASLIE